MERGANTKGRQGLTDGVIISSRVRLARNLAGERFVNSADSETLERVFKRCAEALAKTRKMKGGTLYKMEDLPERDRLMLLETRKVSSDLLDLGVGPRGLYLSKDASCGAMINEEDHLRIFAMGSGLSLSRLWRTVNAFDDDIESRLEYAFSGKYGYLTACPTNAGTGMRASLMMHLPGLVLTCDMEKVVRGVNQLGMTFRGEYGEGSKSPDGIYQLSNQQTMGIAEEDIIGKIVKFGKKIREFELDARDRLRYDNPVFLADKICRAHSILTSCRMIDTFEAASHLSTLRMAADMGFFDAETGQLDAFLTGIQPAHICAGFGAELSSESAPARDAARADFLRGEISRFPAPDVSELIRRGAR